MSLDQKSILVTGGTGSFGRAFVARVMEKYRPKRLIVFSRDEFKQFVIQRDFPEQKYSCMRYFIGDVRDEGRLEMAMRDVDFVIHAAALKQVPAAEYNPFECVRTNIHGAENVVNAAIRAGVKKVVALSTDKAANPINLYGATKLASDKIFIAGNNLSGHTRSRFSVVRYGNVLGSRGSVIEYWRELIRAGRARLPVTDPAMTRFWITLAQGVDFVLLALDQMIGGEIFVPKLPSMKLSDLAHAIAPDMELDVVGIRPGEKIHEIMITRDDARVTLEFAKHFVIEPAFQFWDRNAYQVSNGGKPVAPDFEYSSDTNRWRLSVDEMVTMLRSIP